MSTRRRLSYEDFAAENGELRSLVEQLTARLDAVEAELASVKRNWHRTRRTRQRGHRRIRRERVLPPTQCRACHADLAGKTEGAEGWAQLWDGLPAVVEKVHYRLPRRRSDGGTVTTATPPCGQAGTVSYRPHLNAAAVVLGSEGNVPVERTALLARALLGVEVLVGFVGRAGQRLAKRLEVAGFDEAMTPTPRGEEVLCGDESPVDVLTNDLEEATGEQVSGARHAVTLRTPDARLIWYAGMTSRTKTHTAGA